MKMLILQSSYSILQLVKSSLIYFNNFNFNIKILLILLYFLGEERPKLSRTALDPDTLQKSYQSSSYFREQYQRISEIMQRHGKKTSELIGDDPTTFNRNNTNTIMVSADLLPPESSRLASYFSIFRNYELASFFIFPNPSNFFISVERAFVVKFREREVIIKSITSAVVPATVIGYLAFGTGDYGIYCLSLSGLPVAESMNCGSIIFFISALIYALQLLNIHILCKKLQLFRYEQARKYCSVFTFWFATLISEILFGLAYFLVFFHIIFLMTKLSGGWDKYLFFLQLHICITVLAVCVSIAFTAVFKKEYLIRNVFLVWFFVMIMFSVNFFY